MARKPPVDPNCSTKVLDRVIHYFFLAGTATLVFIILATPVVILLFKGYTQGMATLIFVEALLFFGIVYLADRYIENWRYKNVICK